MLGESQVFKMHPILFQLWAKVVHDSLFNLNFITYHLCDSRLHSWSLWALVFSPMKWGNTFLIRLFWGFTMHYVKKATDMCRQPSEMTCDKMMLEDMTAHFPAYHTGYKCRNWPVSQSCGTSVLFHSHVEAYFKV